MMTEVRYTLQFVSHTRGHANVIILHNICSCCFLLWTDQHICVHGKLITRKLRCCTRYASFRVLVVCPPLVIIVQYVTKCDSWGAQCQQSEMNSRNSSSPRALLYANLSTKLIINLQVRIIAEMCVRELNLQLNKYSSVGMWNWKEEEIGHLH